MRLIRNLQYVGVAVLCAGCVAISGHADDLHTTIARDILSRMERDFFWHESESQNVSNLLHDCEWQRADLTGTNGTNAVVVKINWFSDGRFGISKGHNYVRGAHDQGDFYLYTVENRVPVFVGTIHGGGWGLLQTRSNGYMDIETESHWGWKESEIERYSFAEGRYNLVSSVLCQFDQNATRKVLRVFK